MTEPRPAESEIKRLQAIIERERTKFAEVMTKIKHAVEQRDWMTEGRGPYEWNDDNWHKEFAACGKEILGVLEPLEKIAADLSDCPKTHEEVIAARALPSPGAQPTTCPSCGSSRKDYRKCTIFSGAHNAQSLLADAHECRMCGDKWHKTERTSAVAPGTSDVELLKLAATNHPKSREKFAEQAKQMGELCEKLRKGTGGMIEFLVLAAFDEGRAASGNPSKGHQD